MKKINGGATVWARQTIDSEIFYDKPDKWFKIWFFLVNRVNHIQNRKWERGSCFTTYLEISEKTKATRGQIDMCIRFLKKEQMLTTQKTTRGMHITVVNYDLYQTLDNYKNDSSNDIETTKERHRNDTINKYDKNDKECKEVSEQSSQRKDQPIINVIDAFKEVNPLNKSWYGNTSQRKACKELVDTFGEAEVLKVISILPETNGMAYIPNITTPCQLRDKWAALGAGLKSDKAKKLTKGRGIISANK